MEYFQTGFAGTKVTEDDVLHHSTDLFALPSYNDMIIGKRDVYISAENLTDENGPFRITIIGNNTQYINVKDLELVLLLKLAKEDGTRVQHEDVSFVNNIGASLFETVQVDINNKPITELTQEQYAHKAYIETLLSFSAESGNVLQPRMFLPDKPGLYTMGAGNTKWTDFDSKTVAAGAAAANKIPVDIKRTSVWQRRAYAVEYETFQVITPLFLDILETDRLFPPDTSITLTFIKKPHTFYMLTPETTPAKYKIKIVDMKLHVWYNTLHPEVKLRHDKMFASRQLAYLPFQKVVSLRKQFPSTLTEASYDSCIVGDLPKQLYFMMIDTVDFDGSYNTSPFVMRHNDVENVHLRIDNQLIPSEPLKMDFAKNQWADVYSYFLKNTGYYKRDLGCMINFNEYQEDYTMFAFDFSPDNCNGYHLHRPLKGTLDIKLKFRNALTKATTLLVFAVYDKLLTFDAERDVSIINI